ncbi:MAG: acyl-CoA dehydrogenase family protein [Chloroflexota bacterium]
MSEMQALIRQTTTRFFTEQCTPELLGAAEKGQWPADLWHAFEQTGLHLVSIPEAIGGAGGTLSDAALVLQIAGQFAVPLPLAEIFLAGWVLADAGLDLPDGPFTIASAETIQLTQTSNVARVTGTAAQVPYARHCRYVVAVWRQSESEMKAGIVPLTPEMVTHHPNLANEPRDTLQFQSTPIDKLTTLNTITLESYQSRGALLRTAHMVGALMTILERSIQYAGEREQFGRPLTKFQAIQQYLAQMAGEVAAAQAVMNASVGSVEQDNSNARAVVAMAKIRVGEAAGLVSRLAHQVHGAMGFTQEYPLHFYTKRLWSWRDEFGSEAEWAAWLGQQVAANGAGQFWEFVAR